MDERLQRVFALIDESFAGIQRDEDSTLHQAQLCDHIGDREISDEEWTAAKLLDKETDWRDVPAHFLDECDAALSFTTPKSWHFYLPAYMKRALELRDTYPAPYLPGSVIFRLTYNKKDLRSAGYTIERFAQLTPEQERAVVAFLEYFRFDASPRNRYADDAQEALTNYWALPPKEKPHLIEFPD